ncbi:MAG: FAD-dependent oxidoreductase [Elusimicrobia bacterium]|nr:FAD-dependent oxidoreductase [Elusimicrobiota bacterium]
MRSKKKVAIVGAGPAGFFAAHKLAGHCDVRVLDRGRDIEKRVCQVGTRGRCTKCDPCNIIYGGGGAGLFSDGKLIFDTNIGSTLSEVIDARENGELVDEVEAVFSSYGVKSVKTDDGAVGLLKKKSMQYGITFVSPRQTHIGSDKLAGLMIRMRDDLKKKGVEFEFGRDVAGLDELDADAVILAPGRGGAAWLEGILRENGIPYSYRPVDIGVRVEVPKEITDDVVSISRDMKFYIMTDRYNDSVRTFCTCPEGFVDIEAHDEFVLVNGHSDSEKKSGNTNFAVLVTIPLTRPLVNTNTYANLIARLFNGLGGEKPILQRLGDLRKGRRSREGNQDKFIFSPTLRDVTYGDITLSMPKRYLDNIVEALEKLDNIMPGLAGDSTILYAPEIKFHGLKIRTDRYLCSSGKIYSAGDGAGVSRGIIGAAASGLLAAKGILAGN